MFSATNVRTPADFAVKTQPGEVDEAGHEKVELSPTARALRPCIRTITKGGGGGLRLRTGTPAERPQ